MANLLSNATRRIAARIAADPIHHSPSMMVQRTSPAWAGPPRVRSDHSAHWRSRLKTSGRLRPSAPRLASIRA